MGEPRTRSSIFYQPATWVLSWLDRAGIGWVMQFGQLVSIALVAGAGIYLEVSASVAAIWVASVAAIVALGFAYLGGAQTDRLSTVRDELWRTVKNLNTDSMGHLAVLLSRVRAGGSLGRSPDLEALQSHLLHHLVELVAEHEAIDKRLLSANWVVRHERDGRPGFTVKVYDRNDAERLAPRWHAIEEGASGASQAFLRGEVNLVEDTTAPAVRGVFDVGRPYRTVLSLPVVVQDGIVVGVVNLDGAKPKILGKNLQYLIRHVAYLVALCEELNHEHRRSPDQHSRGQSEAGREGV